MNTEVNIKRQTYISGFTVSLATLMFEILLTRIFSVTMWYHFAFMATSVAMFGMTVGAVLVYVIAILAFIWASRDQSKIKVIKNPSIEGRQPQDGSEI